jgi:hypothetical protein
MITDTMDKCCGNLIRNIKSKTTVATLKRLILERDKRAQNPSKNTNYTKCTQ